MGQQKCIIVGGAGFIGSHVAEDLLKRDFDVHVVDNLSGGRRENVPSGAKFHEIDITHYDELAPVVEGADIIFHLAALPRVQYSIEQPRATHEVNITGTLNVLCAAKQHGVRRVVYSASSSAYGNQDVFPLSENLPAHPISPYALHKYTGELYCRMFSEVYGLETVSLRYFNVYGPRLDPEGAYALVVGKFLKQRSEGKPLTITGDGTQTRDFTHVSDVVRANIRAAESKQVGAGEVINIGAGDNHSVNELAALIGGPVEYIPARLEPHDTLADITRAKTLLNWEPRISFETGVAELKKQWGLS